MSYLRNCWYVAAWSHELPPNSVLGRTYLDEPVVLFRIGDGAPAALSDRCPHRFAPLSAGKVIGRNLQCPYHGLEFSESGACAHNPYGPALGSASIRSFMAIERHRAIWIWMGDQAAADPALIPDLNYLADVPSSAFSAGYMMGRANYEVFIDNIMDLTHTEYLHPTTIAGNGAVHKVRPTTKEVDGGFEVVWFSPNLPPSGLVKKLHPELDRFDMLTRVIWRVPSIMKLVAVTIPVGGLEQDGYANSNAHMMTPETPTSTHYFFAATRNYRIEDTELNNFIAQTRSHIFSTEDKPMIEMVQQRMGTKSFWDLKPRLLGVDEGAVRVRRQLQQLIASEQAEMHEA